MKVTLTDYSCVVEREKGDPAYYGMLNAAGESKLLHAVKRKLNAQGYDFIKKRMWKDGHMMDDMQQYLRERKRVGTRQLAIYSTFWAIRLASEDYNSGEVVLALVDVGNKC